jgi:AcrR family transcriptional regulator
MARTIREEEYAARRKEILDSARRLVYTKGFDLMTIQDILDDLHISKGAFYHYFASKSAVMEALIELMVVDEVLPLMIPIVEDPHLSAIEKLERYFETGLRWKSGKKELMLSLLRIWVADENAIFRQKMFALQIQHVTPLLTEIVRQGVREGVFTTAYPEQFCQMMINIIQVLSDTLIGLFLSEEAERDLVRLEGELTDYAEALADAVERLLGAPTGTLKVIDVDTLMEWFVDEHPSERSYEVLSG